MTTYLERLTCAIYSIARRWQRWCQRHHESGNQPKAVPQDFKIIRFEIKPDTVRKLPSRQRNQVVGCMHAHNELVVLNRLLMFSLNDVGEGELHDRAHGVQMWTIMQMLTGKLFETWNMLLERFLKSNPEDPAVAALNEAHKKDLAWLGGYFGDTPSLKDTTLRTIRDKTGFHYDKLNLDQAVGALTEAESMVYVAEHPANACYYLGSSLLFSTAFAAIAERRVDTSSMNQGERMAAGVKIALDDLNEANFHIHNVLYGLIKHLLERAVGGSFNDLDRLDIPVIGAPKPSDIVLPMFVNVGSSEKEEP